jgi:hypothetical protein
MTEIVDRLLLFCEGWKQQSALKLDVAGCPLWLIRWRCPTIAAWGHILGRGSVLRFPEWGIRAEDVQRRIEELREQDEPS